MMVDLQMERLGLLYSILDVQSQKELMRFVKTFCPLETKSEINESLKT